MRIPSSAATSPYELIPMSNHLSATLVAQPSAGRPVTESIRRRSRHLPPPLHPQRTHHLRTLIWLTKWEWCTCPLSFLVTTCLIEKTGGVLCFLVVGGCFNLVPVFERIPYADDETIGYPHSPEWVPNWLLFLLCTILPLLGIASLSLGWKKSVYDFHKAFLGLAIALTVTMFLTNCVKNLGGRLRPDFLDRCQGSTQLGADGFTRVINCMGDPSTIKEGRKSFPSGHSSCLILRSLSISITSLRAPSQYLLLVSSSFRSISPTASTYPIHP